jgi:hypothetical protein
MPTLSAAPAHRAHPPQIGENLRLVSLDFRPVKIKCCKAAIQQIRRVRPLAGMGP